MKVLQSILLVSFVWLSLPGIADDHNRSRVQTEVAIIEAEVLSLDKETRAARLGLPLGYEVSLVASPDVDLEGISVGDRLTATYIKSVAGELREPTEEELKQPYLLITDEVRSNDKELPGRAGGVMVRAVCTIEALNRIQGTALVQDSRGHLHTIEDIPRERFEGVTIGATVIMTFTQAVAVGLEKVNRNPVD